MTDVANGTPCNNRDVGAVVLAHILGQLKERSGLGSADATCTGYSTAYEEPIRTCLHKAFRLSARDHRPCNNLNFRVVFLQPFDDLELGVVRSLSGVQAYDVGASLCETARTLQCSSTWLLTIIVPAMHDDLGASEELAVEISGHAWEVTHLLDVGSCDHGNEPPLSVHYRELANLRFLQLRLGLFDGDGLLRLDHPGDHDVGDLRVSIFGVLMVTRADEASKLRPEPAIFGDADATDACALLDFVHILQSVVWSQTDRLQNEPANEALGPFDHLDLRVNALVAVDEADATHQRKPHRQL
mmetsp:Transcript_65630/g.152487  ORF Transcript_65630/g.152487 Transcript_65630/m.152487 type:complete len:300 (-) Transcript_65630:271-1170(-)